MFSTTFGRSAGAPAARSPATSAAPTSAGSGSRRRKTTSLTGGDGKNEGVELMGIVNATPDSFSDGGRYRGLDAQLERARGLLADGAAVIDVGGESGVTNRPPVPAEEEAARVVPVIERLAAEGVRISVDTWKAAVARAAVAAGACIVNDVSGLQDPEMAAACAAAGAELVITHTRARPKVKAFPAYGDVTAEVIAELLERVERAEAAGVARERIILDPGLDMSKTPAQSVELLARMGEVVALGFPVLLAASRKDFVGAITGRTPRRRLGGTLAALAAGADAGVAMARVHDVAEAADFLAVRGVLAGERAVPPGPLAEHLRREPIVE